MDAERAAGGEKNTCFLSQKHLPFTQVYVFTVRWVERAKRVWWVAISEVELCIARGWCTHARDTGREFPKLLRKPPGPVFLQPAIFRRGL